MTYLVQQIFTRGLSEMVVHTVTMMLHTRTNKMAHIVSPLWHRVKMGNHLRQKPHLLITSLLQDKVSYTWQSMYLDT